MNDLILHHYDFSPFSEKIRLIFGLKSLPWRSVVIPSVMPKPDLVALTGGYRHTPVLQIGADVYCDTGLIARELDRRYPSPSLLNPHLSGLALAIEAWAERDLFWPIARYVTGTNADNAALEFHSDRAALRGKHPPQVAKVKALGERSLGLVQAQLPRIESMLDNEQAYLLSDTPSLADFAVYHALWFLSAMPINCTALLKPFRRTQSWMARMKSIGHCTSEDMSQQEALEVATRANPDAVRSSCATAFDPPLGSAVSVRPEGYTTERVVGELLFIDSDEIAIGRIDAILGNVVVHFPRVGYALRQLQA